MNYDSTEYHEAMSEYKHITIGERHQRNHNKLRTPNTKRIIEYIGRIGSWEKIEMRITIMRSTVKSVRPVFLPKKVSSVKPLRIFLSIIVNIESSMVLRKSENRNDD